jgi:death-on-curing family protein
MRITFSAEMIHEIHAEIIDTFREIAQRNGEDEAAIVYDVRDPGTLDFIVMAINLAPTPVEQAAVALHRIASQHPFFDGNKRTALIVAETILGEDGWYLEGAQSDDEFILRIARYETCPDDAEAWVRMKMRRGECD